MQVLTFLIGEEKFAVDVSFVDTIENTMPVTVVPKAKDYVTGLISNRGVVIPVINTSMVLHHEKYINVFEKLIILNIENEKIAFEVNEIDNVLDIEPDKIECVNGNEELTIINVDSEIITLLTYNTLKKYNFENGGVL